MKLRKNDWDTLARILMFGAIGAVVMSGIGYLGVDIWLASTQWLLVSAVLALFGIYCGQSSK